MLKQGNEYPTNNVLFVLAESEVGFDAIPPNTSQIIINYSQNTFFSSCPNQ